MSKRYERSSYRSDTSPHLDAEAANAQRAPRRPLHYYRVMVGTKTYTAFSAHDLIERISDRDESRPGHTS